MPQEKRRLLSWMWSFEYKKYIKLNISFLFYLLLNCHFVVDPNKIKNVTNYANNLTLSQSANPRRAYPI
jgi:hypothetical protein